jgi:hypothetical protein
MVLNMTSKEYVHGTVQHADDNKRFEKMAPNREETEEWQLWKDIDRYRGLVTM